MSMFWEVTFETPAGRKAYIVREAHGSTDLREQGFVAVGDFPTIGDDITVEDWGVDGNGPYRDLVLRRTDAGWIEGEVLNVLE